MWNTFKHKIWTSYHYILKKLRNYRLVIFGLQDEEKPNSNLVANDKFVGLA